MLDKLSFACKHSRKGTVVLRGEVIFKTGASLTPGVQKDTARVVPPPRFCCQQSFLPQFESVNSPGKCIQNDAHLVSRWHWWSSSQKSAPRHPAERRLQQNNICNRGLFAHMSTSLKFSTYCLWNYSFLQTILLYSEFYRNVTVLFLQYYPFHFSVAPYDAKYLIIIPTLTSSFFWICPPKIAANL